MKNFLLTVFLIFCILLCACSSSQKYTDDLYAEEILKGAPLIARSADEYDSYDNDYVSFFFGDLSSTQDHILLYSTEQNDINEIGIFHTSDKETTAEVFGSVLDYIAEMQSTQRAFIQSYAPTELSKLDNAEARVYGNYVIYSILSPSDTDNFFAQIEEILKK